MKKFLVLFIILLFHVVVASCAAQCVKDLAWEQAAADVAKPDFGGWKIYMGIAAGGPYAPLVDVPFVSPQTEYTKQVTITNPSWAGTIKNLCFVATAFNKVSLVESDYSNEVCADCDFTSTFSVPINLRIILQ